MRLRRCLRGLSPLSTPWASRCKASDLAQLLLPTRRCLQRGHELSSKERGSSKGGSRKQGLEVPAVPKSQCIACIDHHICGVELQWKPIKAPCAMSRGLTRILDDTMKLTSTAYTTGSWPCTLAVNACIWTPKWHATQDVWLPLQTHRICPLWIRTYGERMSGASRFDPFLLYLESFEGGWERSFGTL